MSTQKFFICKHCKNLIGMVDNMGVPISCCGEQMSELIPNTTEAATEKHIPQVDVSADCINVNVGSTIHPSDDNHYIDFIYLQTENGGQRKKICAGKAPTASFKLIDDKAVAVFAYCNLHGLWKADI